MPYTIIFPIIKGESPEAARIGVSVIQAPPGVSGFWIAYGPTRPGTVNWESCGQELFPVERPDFFSPVQKVAFSLFLPSYHIFLGTHGHHL